MTILAAILDLKTHVEIYKTFDFFNWSAMVKTLCLDVNIFTIGAFLSEIDPFYRCPFWPDDHFGCLFCRHYEFVGHNFTVHVFCLFQVVGQDQKHVPGCYYFYSKCIFKRDWSISLFPTLTRAMAILAAILIWGHPLRFTWLLTFAMDRPWSKNYALMLIFLCEMLF